MISGTFNAALCLRTVGVNHLQAQLAHEARKGCFLPVGTENVLFVGVCEFENTEALDIVAKRNECVKDVFRWRETEVRQVRSVIDEHEQTTYWPAALELIVVATINLYQHATRRAARSLLPMPRPVPRLLPEPRFQKPTVERLGVADVPQIALESFAEICGTVIGIPGAIQLENRFAEGARISGLRRTPAEQMHEAHTTVPRLAA